MPESDEVPVNDIVGILVTVLSVGLVMDMGGARVSIVMTMLAEFGDVLPKASVDFAVSI